MRSRIFAPYTREVATDGGGGPADAGGSAAIPCHVDKHWTGFTGRYTRVAVRNASEVHLIYTVPNTGVRHATYAGGVWSAASTIPGSSGASTNKYNIATLAVGPDGKPHVVWGAKGSPYKLVQGTTDQYYCDLASAGVWYWNGATNKTTKVFSNCAEYVAVGVSSTGKKVFAATAIPAALGGVVWAELVGDTPGTLKYFDLKETTITAKNVSFCGGQDGALHLVGQLGWLDHVNYQNGVWGAPETLGQKKGAAALGNPGCAVSGGGDVNTAWIQWTSTPSWHPVDIRYSRWGGSGWLPTTAGIVLRTLPGAISSTALVAPPSVATDTTGEVVVVTWAEDKDLFMASSLDGGGTFSAACILADDVNLAHEFEGASAFFADGKFHVMYPNASDQLIHATLQ